MRKSVIGFAICIAVCFGMVRAYSETVNPASNVLADSDATANTIVLRPSSGSTNIGAATVTTLTGTSAYMTGTGGSVRVSTASTSSNYVAIAGAFYTLPTSGYAAGCIAYQLSDNTLYVSTATVSNSGHWKALY